MDQKQCRAVGRWLAVFAFLALLYVLCCEAKLFDSFFSSQLQIALLMLALGSLLASFVMAGRADRLRREAEKIAEK